jgi:ubiquitin-activating enzyme E1
MLKNLAGMGCGLKEHKGSLHITDMDKIEKSNLNRQFLFRPKDVGSSKSAAAARAVQEMNPHVSVVPYEDKVSPDTEGLFGDDFFSSLSAVITALDNVEARLYVD